jgi:hypothetical protein
VILKSDPDTKYSFEYFFNVNGMAHFIHSVNTNFIAIAVNSGDFETISMPIDGFQPYFRGKIIQDVPPLDLSDIRVFGLQIAGGVYDANKKQFGVSSLELKAVTSL